MTRGMHVFAGLLPSFADLCQALRFALVAALTCGLGFLAGARRLETALFTGWGVACLVFVVAGCLLGSSLIPPAVLLAGLGAAGWVLAARRGAVGREAMALRVLALGAPLFAILLSLRSNAYDDFSFWAPNLLALCATGHFPSAAHPLTSSFMPGYPRGVALAGYATFLLGPDLSPAGKLRLLATGPWWNILLMLGVAAALAALLRDRLLGERLGAPAAGPRTGWALAGLAILLQSFLNPGFISKMTLSNMGDAGSASGLAMLVMLLFELPQAGEKAPRIVTEMALTAAAVAFIRQDNPALLLVLGGAMGLGLLLWSGAGRARLLAWLAVAALPALAVTLTWNHYTALHTPGGQHSLLPPPQWHWAAYHYTLRAALQVFISKGLYTMLGLGFGAAFLAMLAGRGPATPSGRILLTATAGLVYGNAAFIMFTYLATSFSQVEVRTAVTFWRFLAQTTPAEMSALILLLPAAVPEYLTRPGWVLAAFAALLPVALIPTPYTFRNDLSSPVPAFLAIGQDIAAALPAGARLTLLDNSDGSGYAAWLVHFGIVELGGARVDATPDFGPQSVLCPRPAPAAIPAGSYVWLSQAAGRPLYLQGVSAQPWHAYLFRRDPAGLTVLRDWPVPPYGNHHQG